MSTHPTIRRWIAATVNAARALRGPAEAQAPVAHGFGCTLPWEPCDGCGPQPATEAVEDAPVAGGDDYPKLGGSSMFPLGAPYTIRLRIPDPFGRDGSAAGNRDGLPTAEPTDARDGDTWNAEPRRPGTPWQYPPRPDVDTPCIWDGATMTVRPDPAFAVDTRDNRFETFAVGGFIGEASAADELPPVTSAFSDAWENAEDVIAYQAGVRLANTAHPSNPSSHDDACEEYRPNRAEPCRCHERVIEPRVFDRAADELVGGGDLGPRRAMLVLAGYCGVPLSEVAR